MTYVYNNITSGALRGGRGVSGTTEKYIGICPTGIPTIVPIIISPEHISASYVPGFCEHGLPIFVDYRANVRNNKNNISLSVQPSPPCSLRLQSCLLSFDGASPVSPSPPALLPFWFSVRYPCSVPPRVECLASLAPCAICPITSSLPL
ncbi:unnamed protein product [Ectocarpus sp. 8 AP-2014]